MLADTEMLIGDGGRVIALLLFALFLGGALRVLWIYKLKNDRFRKATGSSRPMFKHVLRVSVGAVLTSISALTNNLERLGDGWSWYVPLNLIAFGLLYSAMVSMMKEATHKAGWLRPADEENEAKQFAEEVVAEAVVNPEAAKELIEVADEVEAEKDN